ncbi:MAG: uracil-DNA glycosylase [Chloroflexi bacterium]|nr:uracil-DNA glycosylase [Chloroflexota bacterium]
MQQGRLFDPTPGGYASLAAVRADCLTCTHCDLALTRRLVVFGAGDPAARLMIVGEGPSEADDTSGLPFSGPSGVVLDQWLAAIGTDRDRVWLTNVVRCRAAGPNERGRLTNRPPTAREMAACRAWLLTEIGFVRPAVLLGLGGTAGKALLGKDFRLTQGRGRWADGPSGIATLVTFLPAYLMRLEEPELGRAQAFVDADLAAVRARLAAPP